MKVLERKSGKVETRFSGRKIKLFWIGLVLALISVYIAPPWELGYGKGIRDSLSQAILAWATCAFFAWHMLFTRAKITINHDTGMIEYRLISLFPVTKRLFPISKVQAVCIEKLPARKHVSYSVFLYFKEHKQSLHLSSGALSEMEPLANAIAGSLGQSISIKQ